MKYDLIIIGSGPAGYVGAIRAGQTGLKTLVIDRKHIGGMCLNWGCIPSKTWLESAKLYHKTKDQSSYFGIGGIDPDKLSFDWDRVKSRTNGVVTRLSRGIEFLWKKNGVEYLQAEAHILSPNTVEADKRIFETDYIMIATGSRPGELENVPKLIGLQRFPDLEALPKKPIIWGQGAIAFEMSQFFKLIGAEPTLALTSEKLLPDLDPFLQGFVDKKLRKEKIKMIPAEKINFEDSTLDFDAVINCSHRKAVLPSMVIKLELKDGYIATGDSYQSSIPNIYAAGDVNGKSYLAHAASAQAIEVINHIHGKTPDLEAALLWPINIYSDPEIAQIGKTEPQLKAEGIEYQSVQYSMMANGKALAEGSSEGFLRLLYEPKYSQVLGVQIVAPNATDMIAEAALLLEMEGTVYDLARAVHAHPTVSEVFMDAGSEAVHLQDM